MKATYIPKSGWSIGSGWTNKNRQRETFLSACERYYSFGGVDLKQLFYRL